jgi:hypothetical protein
MTLEQIFYLSQSVASVAVVGSLIYLGLQVRSAERSQRAIMQQGRADRASNAALAIASPELARVFQKRRCGRSDTHPRGTHSMDDDVSRTVSKRRRFTLAVQSRAARSTRIRQLRWRCPLLDGINWHARRVEAVGRTIRRRVSRIRKLSLGADPRGARCGRLFRVAETPEIGIAHWSLGQESSASLQSQCA